MLFQTSTWSYPIVMTKHTCTQDKELDQYLNEHTPFLLRAPKYCGIHKYALILKQLDHETIALTKTGGKG